MSQESQDLSLNGPGSPVSLKKAIKKLNINGSKDFTVFIDGTGDGIAMDDPETVNITTEECKKQALYLIENVFEPSQRIPAYAIRHIVYMYDDTNSNYKYKSVKEVIDAIGSDPEHEDYKLVFNKFTYGRDNAEFLQILGLLSLIAGTFNMARKENKNVRIYIQHPETHLHPKRQSKAVTFLNALKDEYSYDGSGNNKTSSKVDSGEENN